jgi:cob(I)alamin adenosyltransferase
MPNWFFTGKGDQGDSLLSNGEKLPKSSIEFELIGTLDEVTALIGLAICNLDDPEIIGIIKQVQQELSFLMGIVAKAKNDAIAPFFNLSDAVENLEKGINYFGKDLGNPKKMVFSGDSLAGAHIDVARTVIRRAERVSARMIEGKANIAEGVLQYLNRLSSLFYIIRLRVDKNRPVDK